MDENDITPRHRTGPAPLFLASEISEPRKADETDIPRRVTALELLFGRVQKLAWSAVLAVLASLGTATVYVLTRTHASGAEEQQMIDLQRAFDRLDADVREIRAELRLTHP